MINKLNNNIKLYKKLDFFTNFTNYKIYFCNNKVLLDLHKNIYIIKMMNKIYLIIKLSKNCANAAYK